MPIETVTFTAGADSTPPAGTKQAVDDIGTGTLVPYVKLMSGTDAASDLIPGTAADGLLVNLGANNDVTVTGTVTANAGTNLNTSALALEGGGNLAAAAASLSVLDDWDETDRAKVNPIVGQAGVAAGAGAVGLTTQRVTLASDDPAVVALQLIDNAIAGSEMQVDVLTMPTVTVDSELPAAAALADNAANPTAPAVGAFGMVWDGVTWDRLPGTSVDGMLVNLGANNDVTFSGAVDTELPAAAALADNAANPTAPAVGAFAMVWDGTTWDRLPGTSVDGALVNLGANNDVTLKDGSGNSLTSKAAGSERAITVAIVDTTGAHLGGGTEYTETNTDASITGVAVMWEDTGDTLRAVSAAKPFPVSIISGGGTGGTAIADEAAFTEGSTNFTPVGGIYNTTSDTVTNGMAGAFQMNSHRAAYVRLTDESGNYVAASGGVQYTHDNPAAATPTITMAGAVRQDTLAASTDLTADNTYLKVNSLGELYVRANLTLAEDALHTSGEPGVMALTVRRDTPTNLVSGEGDYAPAEVDAVGKLWVRPSGGVASGVASVDNPLLIGAINGSNIYSLQSTTGGALLSVPTAHTTGGASIFRTLDLDETEEEVKATAGQMYGYYFYNANASLRYLKFYNDTAANVIVGTTAPVLTMPLPATSAGHISFPVAVTFSTAICAAATTGLADADTGAPGTNDVILNVYYK